jgi:hypothetical protein
MRSITEPLFYFSKNQRFLILMQWQAIGLTAS